jgi:CxxC-x17-CxxC domain-containing protein
MKKATKSKSSKQSKSVQSSLSVEQDIVGLITTLVHKLVSLEAKIDTVLSRLPQQKPADAVQQMPKAAPVQLHNNNRPMYQVICADCGKNCEVPFKPASGRPVYCKECFSKRKVNGSFASRPEVKPSSPVPASQTVLEKAPKSKPVKSAAAKSAGSATAKSAKKSAAKKKSPAKKAKK